MTGCERENDILLRVVVIVLGVWRPCDPLANPNTAASECYVTTVWAYPPPPHLLAKVEWT